MTVLALAVVLDLLVGDPPNRWHPVAWIGRLITLARGRAPRAPDDLALYGTFLILIVAGLAAGAALVAQALLGELPGPAAPLAQAWLLKCSFALSGLFAAVEIVRGHLVAGDLDGARRQVAWHLVSRDTTGLDEGAVAGGVAGGLALAWAYRAVNTADAMIGYRRDDLEYLGRATARTDDALNYVPARLAAGALVAGAWLARQSAAGAARALRRDGRRTESPNAGLTMAAMAGALGVTLEKRGHYHLGAGPPPDPAAIDRAMQVARWTGALCVGAAALALVARP